MDTFKLIGIGICGTVLAITVKQYRPEFSVLVAVITSVVLLFYTASGFSDIIGQMNEIIHRSGIDREYLTVILKLVGIAYITQFAAEICRDSGQGAIALKLEAAGKIVVLMLSMPVISRFLEVCIDAVNRI